LPATGAFAQTAYPTKPVRIICLNSAWPADIYARLSVTACKKLSTPFRDREQARRGAIIGTDAVANPPRRVHAADDVEYATVNESLFAKKLQI